MQNLADLDLPQIDMFDPNFATDPHAVYAAAHEKSWIAQYQFGYLLLDYEAMKDFMRDDARCREPNQDIIAMWGAEGTPFARFTGNQLVALRGDEHKRIRDLVAPAFTPRAANKHREFMKETMEAILDDVANRGVCDFAEISSRYPITVMCRLIGVSPDDVQNFAKWLEPQEAAFGMDPAILPELNEATDNMFNYVSGLIDERRKPGNHPKDLLQDLVDLAAEDGDALNDEELRCLLVLLLGAGFDTTKNQLNLIMKMLMDHPDELDKLSQDPSRLKPLIEESLRYKNAIGSLHRVTDVDIQYRDVVIPANTFLSIPITYHGRDKTFFDDADTFDPDRSKSTPPIAFGQGMHICLGQFLARALLEEGLPIIARRMQNPKLAGDIEYRSPLAIWGYKSMPIEFNSVPA